MNRSRSGGRAIAIQAATLDGKEGMSEQEVFHRGDGPIRHGYQRTSNESDGLKRLLLDVRFGDEPAETDIESMGDF